MLARWLRLILLFELSAFFIAGVLLTKLFGWSAGASVLAMCGLALAWRAWVVGVTYAFAALHRSPVPAQYQLGFAGALREGGRELLAFIAFTLVEPFENLFPGPDRPARMAAGQPPLLLIHGYNCNRSFWWWLKPRLEAHGRGVATLTLEPVYADIDSYVHQLALRIEDLCRATGAERVILVGHSMGGLVGRAYLRRHGGSRVARLVTLGTPHHGSELARLGIGRNARQLEAGSAWLQELAATPLEVPCIALYSTHDNYVMPQANAMLAGADNRALPGVGHLAMAISPAVLAALLEATAG